MTTAHKILGWVEEVTTCDCCGKARLSGTFAVDLNGDILHYGSTCVTRNTGIKNPKTAADRYLQERTEAATRAARQTPEYAAYRARFALRDRSNIEIGKASADFVRDVSAALDAKCAEIAASFGLKKVWA
jgi:predicted deacetylase